jgi:hypothetical protein
MVLGTQNKALKALRSRSGDDAGFIARKIYSAAGLSPRAGADMIGEEEGRPRIGTTAMVQATGRDNQLLNIHRTALGCSKEQIMALKDLHGYWKYSDVVVPFRIEPLELPSIAPQFMKRFPLPPAEQMRLPERGELPTANWSGRTVYSGEPDRNCSTEITAEPSDDLDLKF